MRAKTAVLLAALGFVAALTTLRAAMPPDDKAIVHVLNRIGYGPRPGDVEKVRQMGLQKYIDEQLHPERIADSAMEARLSSFTTLHMSSSEISEHYELPQLEQRRLRQQAARGADPDAAMPGARRPGAPGPDGAMLPERGRGRGRGDAAAMRQPPQQPAATVVNELQEQKLLRAVYSERQLQEVLTDFWFNHFNVDARKGRDRFLLTEYERDAIRPHVLGSFRDLLGATAKSPAMLFYLDNFMSVDPNASGPGARGQRPPIAARGAQGRGAQGRGALGRGGQGRGGQGRGLPGGAGGGFPMPGGVARGRGVNTPDMQQPQAPANRAPRGLNENYGRELMELHTLGVDGGYTQKDVTEVARALTGWTLDNPRQGSSFRFDERLHDKGEKIVLGHKIKSGGIKDGEDVLDILASHPSTARFIATKLARRFVSDTPSPALVDRLAKKFRDTKGDLREVMRALFTAPEFLSPAAYDAKVKTPLEFVVSAARATGAGLTSAQPLVRALQQLGMPLYECQPPTGYKDTADAWTNTGALVARMNFATTLATNRQFGIAGGQRQSMSSPDTVIDTILGGAVSETTRATIARASSVPQMVALTLGSPEFQRR